MCLKFLKIEKQKLQLQKFGNVINESIKLLKLCFLRRKFEFESRASGGRLTLGANPARHHSGLVTTRQPTT